MLPDRQDRDRPGPVPGPPLRRLVPAHHAGHAGARLPVRHRGDRPKSPGSGLIPVTLGEVRRLLAHLINTDPRHGLVPVGPDAPSTAPEPATTSEDRPNTTKCGWSINPATALVPRGSKS